MQSPFIPANPDKVVTGVAIGQNAYARSGSVMVGTHNFKGKLYDTTVDTSDIANMRSNNVVVNATTVGTNSWNNAPLVLLMALIPLLPALMMAVGSVLIQLKILVLRSPVP